MAEGKTVKSRSKKTAAETGSAKTAEPAAKKPRTRSARTTASGAQPATQSVSMSSGTATWANGHDRHEMIRVAAYFRAERRGFANGSPEDDWFAAEAEIDAFLAGSSAASSGYDLHTR